MVCNQYVSTIHPQSCSPTATGWLMLWSTSKIPGLHVSSLCFISLFIPLNTCSCLCIIKAWKSAYCSHYSRIVTMGITFFHNNTQENATQQNKSLEHTGQNGKCGLILLQHSQLGKTLHSQSKQENRFHIAPAAWFTIWHFTATSSTKSHADINHAHTNSHLLH